MYRDKIDAYIDSHRDEMVEDLKELVRINSIRGEAKPGMPFGEGPAAALKEAARQMEKIGLRVTDYDGYVVAGDFGEGRKVLDILAHLDVVPVTEDWTVTQPFVPLVKDGRIYGRGTADDKGPAMAALYAIRAIKELGIPMKNGVRLILGSDEECGSSDLEHYYAIEKEADYTFSPDADFPLINIEKARLAKKFHVSFDAQTQVPRLGYFKAGDKVNVVPGKAEALVIGMDLEAVSAIAEEAAAATDAAFTCEKTEDGVAVVVKGTAAHASTPELGNSALTALLTFTGKLPLADGAQKDALAAAAKLFPHKDVDGTAMGVAMSDEISGALTQNLGVLNCDENGLSGEFDMRAPICATDENLTEVVRSAMAALGLTMEEGKMTPAHHVPEESELVQTLLGSYERYTGIKGKPFAIGGGTYVHELERGVAFGCMTADVDNHMHGDDEFMEIETMIMSAKIFADAIVKLCN